MHFGPMLFNIGPYFNQLYTADAMDPIQKNYSDHVFSLVCGKEFVSLGIRINFEAEF